MNWTHIIDTLRSRGWTQVLLAARLGVVQSAISDLRTGATKDPKHSTGQAILDLMKSGEVPVAVDAQAEPTKAAA